MGQSNYTLLNKASTYLYWNSLWYSNASLKNYVHMDVYIKQLLLTFFFNKSTDLFFYNQILNSKIVHKFSNLSDSAVYSKTIYKPYNSKIWLLQFKNWLLLSCYFFYPQGLINKDQSYAALDDLSDQSLFNFTASSKAVFYNYKPHFGNDTSFLMFF